MKSLAAAALALLLCLNLAAQEKTPAPSGADKRVPLALSFFPLPLGNDAGTFASVGFGPLVSRVSDVSLLQMAAFGSMTVAGSTGLQASGLFNWAGTDSRGVQASGLFNVVAGTSWVAQASGLFNVAGTVKGIQAAPLFNKAKDVDGVQIGLVNFSDNMNGLAIGLFNFVKNGIRDTGIWSEDSDWSYGFMQVGTPHVYTILYAGTPRTSWRDKLRIVGAGFGVGYRIGSSKLAALDMDLSAKAAFPPEYLNDIFTSSPEEKPNVFPSARVSARLAMGLGIAFHGGIIMDAQLHRWATVPLEMRTSVPWTPSGVAPGLRIYPKWFLGVSI